MAGINLVLLKCLTLICFSTASSLHLKSYKSYEPKLELVPGKETIQGNYISYYMYNITNPDEFESGEKPMLSSIGPYTYRETRRKFDVKKISESVMSYNLDRVWEFVPELSEGHEETDEFNIINIPLIILANKLSAKRLPKAFNDILVDELIEKGETLVRRNEQVGNIIYHGINVSVYTEILHDVLGGNVPPEFQDNIFALLKGKNGSSEGTFTVKTKPRKEMGNILTFNNKTKLEYWGGDFCNKIEGTDGYFFRPEVNNKSTLKIFYPELCRSVYLKWTGEEKSVDGIKVEKFTFPEEMLEDPEVKTENTCFCSKPITPTNNTKAGCLKKGFVDYSSCKQDSPLLVSYPHFLYAHEEYGQKLVGMKPLAEKHESQFLIEPNTGTILSGIRRFQFNIKLRSLDNVELFRNTSFMIFPVFITEKKIIVPQERIKKLKEDLMELTEPVTKPKELPQPHPVQKKDTKVIEIQEVINTTIQSDQPQPQSKNNVPSKKEEEKEGTTEPEPESEPELIAEDNEINTSETKYKSQSVTRNRGIKNNYQVFSMLSNISLLLVLSFSFSIL